MMSANMAKLSFKVFLMNDDSTEHMEVRRFCIDADVATNFLYLREKLQTIFPDLRGKNFTVTWKDEDDTITLSTNEELEIAVDEMAKRGLVNKLYVYYPDRERGDMPDIPRTSKSLHPGIICDVCDKNIRGFRFKCMQCPDYDLCTDCMVLGYHPEHYMVRMTEPLEWSGYQSRRLAHHMRKFLKKTAGSPHGNKNDETRRCQYRSSSKRSTCPAYNIVGGNIGFDPSIVDSLATFVKKVCVPLEESSHEQKRSKERREPSAEAATEATEDPQQEETKHSFSQLLKIFEDNISNISQFLDPLGINVIVTADNDNSTKNGKPADNTQTESTNNTSKTDAAKKFPGEGKKLRDDTTTEKVTFVAPATNDEASSSQPKVTSPEQAAEADEWTMVGRETSPNVSRTSSNSSSLNGAIPKQTLPVSAPSAPSPPTANPETEPKQNLYPPLPENEYFHPNPKIQFAVERMMAMGFSNEGGWLTHLLVSKDGDISKALDVLQPVRLDK